MKILVLAALLAAVACSHLSSRRIAENHKEWPWQVGKLYRYDVESHTLAQLEEGASTGNVFKARFIIRVPEQGRLLVRLEKPQHAVVHERLEDKNLPEDLKYEEIKNFEVPFEIFVEGGRVKSMRVPKSMSLAQENLLKGLIGALQVDLSTYRTVQAPQNYYDKDSEQGQFKKMETDVTGDCETLYSVTPVASEWRRELPRFANNEDPIEITKSKSYGHCHHRVAYHFGVPNEAEWTGTAHKADEKQFIKRATNSRILVGRQGPIFKAETTSTVHVHPHMYGKQKAEVLSYVKFYLLSHEEDKESEWQQPEEYREIEHLLYSMSTKKVTISDKSSSSSSSESREHKKSSEEKPVRERRSTPKIISINKVIVKKRSDEDSSSSSSDSSSTYVNDDIPSPDEPAYASLYRQQSPMNAKKLTQEMAQQLQNPDTLPKADFLSKFIILVRVIASMSPEQLAETTSHLEIAKSSDHIIKADMWMIYRDAVAHAGTLPAFQQIRSWIQKKALKGEEAAEVVASMVNTLAYPTKQTMMQFFQLAMSDEVKEQKYLNSTALIAATRLINMAQVNNDTAHSYYPTHLYGRLARQHDNFVYEEVLPRLRQALEQAIQQEDSRKAQVYIKAIGNLGHRSILEVYSPYLEGKVRASTYLRALMVHNLHILAQQKDRYVRAVLYNILRNTAEHYEVRVAAIQNIFLGHPTAAMMQAMADMTHDDPSIQVRAALKSAIETAAKLKHPRYWELARTAQAACSSLTKERLGKHYSSKKFDDYFDSEYELGFMTEVASTGSEDSLVPKFFEFAHERKTAGWSSVSASVSSVKKLVDYVKLLHHRQVKSGSDHKYPAEKISEMLNIKRESDIPFEASLYINLMNQQRYFTFSEEDLKELPRFLGRYAADLAKGVDKHYTKVLHQAAVTVVFPVASGMPFIYRYREPTVIHMQSKAKGEFKLPWEEKNDKPGYFNKELEFTFARNLDGSVGFMDTLSNQIASVGIINKVQLNIPMKLHLEMQPREVKIHLEPLHPEQDKTLLHFSVWPYSANQKKDSLVTVAHEKTTKVIERKERFASVDTKFGQSIGTVFHLQGYSYSTDYKSLNSIFKTPELLPKIVFDQYQKDIALTHYNFRYLGKMSQNKRLTLTVAYDKYYNQKRNAQTPIAVSNVEDVTPNSPARREEMVKRVVSGINTAKARVVDISATFDGPQKTEYVITTALASSPVDSKIQYAFFAGKNSAQGNCQINGVGTVHKPDFSSMNFLEALKKDLKMKFEIDMKFGKNNEGNIRVQGHSERTKKYAEDLMRHPDGKRCAEEIARDNFQQQACRKMLIMAHAADYFKVSVTYKDVSPVLKLWLYKAYKIAEHYGFWYTETNPLKTTTDGKLDVELQANYLEKHLNLVLNSRYGEVRMRNVPIPKVSASFVNTYYPIKLKERIYNYVTKQQYLPYCAVDDNKVKTFNGRNFDYTLTRSWHVVVQDLMVRPQFWKRSDDRLVVLARKPSEKQQEIYISFQSKTGKELEIEMQPAVEGSKKPVVRVKTNAKKVSEGELTNYWDDEEHIPLLEYYTQPDGVLILNIREDRLRVMYDGSRLVVLTSENRNNTRGICGYMSGEMRDDYLTPFGLVDNEDHYAASYALKEQDGDAMTLELQQQAKQLAYQLKYKYTTILHSDSEWKKVQREDSSSEEKWVTHSIYHANNYSKMRGPCRVVPQVQFYENQAEICITTHPIDSCQSHCTGHGHTTQSAKVVCRPKLDQMFKQYRDLILNGESPKVSGLPHIRQYRVPTSCKA